MDTKIARVILLLLMVLLVYLAILPSLQKKQFSDKEIVIYESLQCVTAVCISDVLLGKECRYLDPFVAKVTINLDVRERGKRQIEVVPTEEKCF